MMIYNVKWHILFLLHITIINITKMTTKTAELYNLDVYDYA